MCIQKRHKNEAELAENKGQLLLQLQIFLILKTLEENVTEGWVPFPSHFNDTDIWKSESTERHFSENKCHQSDFFHEQHWVIYMNECLVVIEKFERYWAKREHKYRGSGIFILRKPQKTTFSTLFFYRSIYVTFREKSIVHKATMNLDTSKASR